MSGVVNVRVYAEEDGYRADVTINGEEYASTFGPTVESVVESAGPYVACALVPDPFAEMLRKEAK